MPNRSHFHEIVFGLEREIHVIARARKEQAPYVKGTRILVTHTEMRSLGKLLEGSNQLLPLREHGGGGPGGPPPKTVNPYAPRLSASARLMRASV